MNVYISILVLSTLIINVAFAYQIFIQEKYFNQKLDHFRGKHAKLTFPQRFFIDDANWKGSKNSSGPIFVFFGGESTALALPRKVGILNQAARESHAMVMYIEHRFYGKSIPLGAIEDAMGNETVRACLTIEQALADFKIIILSLKSNLSAHHSPVVVMGGGYSGVLATYFRLKYPNIAIGALASSAPILLFGTSTPRDNGYCSAVSKNFEDIDSRCYHNIKDMWKKLDDIASKPGGLENLSYQFERCRAFKSLDEIKNSLAGLYSFAGQYYDPNTHMWIRRICGYVNGDTGNLRGVALGLIETVGHGTCFERSDIQGVHSPFEAFGSNWSIAWDWQRCKELVFPVGCDTTTMLPVQLFNASQFRRECRARFSVVPNSNLTESLFGSENITEILREVGSNIIFSNGLRDPFSSAGILEDLSDTVVAIKTIEGNYQWDLGVEFEDVPHWLIDQREEELRIMRQWIGQESRSIKLANYDLLLCCLGFLLLMFYM